MPRPSLVALLLALVLPRPLGAEDVALLGPVLAPSDVAPGFPSTETLPRGVLQSAALAYERGDLLVARRELEALIEDRRVWGIDRLDAHFLLGWINERLGQHQQASSNYYKLRAALDHPLREFAIFLEARADLARGHERTAIEECAAYLVEWPEGRWADECLLVEADGNVRIGLVQLAIEQYEAFLAARPDDQRQEAIALRIARALEQLGSKDSAGRRYRALYLDHKLPTTGQEAEAALRRIEASGTALPALTDDDLYVRACSLRRSGEFDASYQLFCDLDGRNPAEDPSGNRALGERLDDERHEFLWRNRQYDVVGEERARAYDRAPQATGAVEHAYWAVQGFSRAGRFDEAVKYQLLGMARHGNSGRFEGTEERLALLYMGAAKYTEARAAYQAWAEASPSVGRSAELRFHLAYTAYRAGDLPTAEVELEELASGGGAIADGARFYLGKVQERLKKWAESKTTLDAVVEEAPDSWYAEVVRNRRRAASRTAAPRDARDGSWRGGNGGPPGVPASGVSVADGVRALFRGPLGSGAALDPEAPPRGPDGARRPPASLPSARPSEPDRDALLAELRAQDVPPTWQESTRWDRATSAAAWSAFVAEHGVRWPDLPVALELSRIGLGEIAGPMLKVIYEEIREAQRSKRLKQRVASWKKGGRKPDPELERAAAAQAMTLRSRDWLGIFSAAGYPGSVTSFAGESVPYRSLGRGSDDARATWTLAYPAAFAPQVWRAASESGVDPLLMLSIMRAESLYRHDAVSPVGALGLIQVMPATGARVAALAGRGEFRTEELLDPAVNISLGTFYMGRLLARFGPGMFPMAVGSYNGGPHNLGRWLKAKVGIDLEDFVEEIAFEETRTYIKRVTSYYVVYADLYAGGAGLAIPAKTTVDDASVIDF